MTWGDPYPPILKHLSLAISTFCSLFGYLAAWVSHFLGEGGFTVRDGDALKAAFPEAGLERWGWGEFRGETGSPGFAHQGLDTKSLVDGCSSPSLG